MAATFKGRAKAEMQNRDSEDLLQFYEGCTILKKHDEKKETYFHEYKNTNNVIMATFLTSIAKNLP